MNLKPLITGLCAILALAVIAATLFALPPTATAQEDPFPTPNAVLAYPDAATAAGGNGNAHPASDGSDPTYPNPVALVRTAAVLPG